MAHDSHETVQVTQREFQLTEDFTAPKGALLMPSLIASSMQVRWQHPWAPCKPRGAMCINLGAETCADLVACELSCSVM